MTLQRCQAKHFLYARFKRERTYGSFPVSAMSRPQFPYRKVDRGLHDTRFASYHEGGRHSMNRPFRHDTARDSATT
jgi:hypothetical protein